MARKRRIWYPGAMYHVISRGNRRSRIFRKDRDYVHFLEIALEVRVKYPFLIHSLCLMPNHIHILLGTIDVDPGKIMHKMLGSYAGAFNYRYNCKGHLFESRYTAPIIDSQKYLLEVSRYIHLNPVKAAIVDDPADYKYSSYSLFVEDLPAQTDVYVLRMLSDLVDTTRVLSCFHEDPQEQYRAFVAEKMPPAVTRLSQTVTSLPSDSSRRIRASYAAAVAAFH